MRTDEAQAQVSTEMCEMWRFLLLEQITYISSRSAVPNGGADSKLRLKPLNLKKVLLLQQKSKSTNLKLKVVTGSEHPSFSNDTKDANIYLYSY